MKLLSAYWLFLLGLCLVEGKWQKYDEAIKRLTEDNLFRSMAAVQEYERQDNERPIELNFACPRVPSDTVPTSVHALKPGDIQVVGAIGDSITAGTGANAGSLFTAAFEYRDILRTFNPNLYGFSNGIGNRDSTGSRLNVAEGGADNRHVLEQAQLLVQRMMDDVNVNFNEDWKLITIFIGENDLCNCFEPFASVEMYGSSMEDAILYLHDNVPRAIVQLASVIDVGPLSEMGGFICSFVHLVACDCVVSSFGRSRISALTAGFQSELTRITNDPKFHDRDDFTVLLQPFFENGDLPRTSSDSIDTSFFAPDCFHFSKKGHQALAINIWKNMFEEVGQKSTNVNWDPAAQIVCPTQEQFIATSLNGKK